MIDDALLDHRLTEAVCRYRTVRPRSEELARAAAEVMPGGNTRTVLHFDPFPFRVANATGSTLEDVDGHRYIDLLGNYTAGLLGHSPRPIRDAIDRALDNGWALGTTHETEVEFARLLVDRFPSLEQVRFTNSGTEANLLSLAAAKHHTQRSSVLVFEGGYHGGVLYFGHQREANVPHDFVIAPFNDIAALEELFARHEFAAALIEPMLGSGGCIPATEAFLRSLRDLCTAQGTILIFDEVMTSRLSPGGAQQVTGVHPDLTTLGKYLAGGMSFGAFGGRREVMAVFDQAGPRPLGHAGTFNNNVLTMAAGVATLREVLTDEVLDSTNQRGDRLRNELSRILAHAKIPMGVTGWGSLLNIHPTAAPIQSTRDLENLDERWRSLLFFDAMEAGFYFARRGFIALSVEITDTAIDDFVAFVQSWADELSGVDQPVSAAR
jgi:glutamate-1-semialdehyde 2,1-aminomutase